MTDEQKLEIEEGALVNRDGNNKTISSLKKRVWELEKVISVLEKDKDDLGSENVDLDKKWKAEKARAEKAERILNEGKPLEGGKTYENLKKETFEERFSRKWGQSARN
jgi:hypothetical protein